MKRLRLLLIVVTLCLLLLVEAPVCKAFECTDRPVQEDSNELRLQDMLVLLLLPYMDKRVGEEYAAKLNERPQIYPYFVKVIETKRLNGFRGFDLFIVLEVVPTVGPHISVGRDRFSFQISPGSNNVKLAEFKHLEDPNPSDLPPNWKDILIK